VFFAYSLPYSFTRLIRLIDEIRDATDIFKVDTLCKSLSGVDVPLLTITNLASEEPKKVVVMTARVHPGETPASWMMEGVLRFLVSGNKKACELRDRLIFKIVPMLNPDGVIVGNYRTSFSGNDLNRKYQNPDPRLHPTVTNLKRILTEAGRNLLAFIDMHGHSKKKSSFMYGPRYPLHNKRYFKMRVLPKLMSEKCEMFRYYSCKFRNEKSKQKAARLVIWKEYNLMNSFTLETSFHGYLNSDRATIVFDEDNLKEIGRNLCTVMLSYMHLLEDEKRERAERRAARKKKLKKQAAAPETAEQASDAVPGTIEEVK
jgi:hypothetical protein